MDEYPKHYAKWKKPDTQIIYYLISHRGGKMVATESRPVVSRVCGESGETEFKGSKTKKFRG